MPYALGALTDSTGTITVHSATPTDSPQVAALSAIALRPIVAKDPARVLAFQELSTALQHVRHDGLLRVVDVTHAGGRPIAVAPLPTGSPLSRLLVSPESCARRFALEPSVRLVLGAARAVQVLHAARPDLRPLGFLSADTIWVTVEGHAVVLPSARCAPVGAFATAKPTAWGRYRAPEWDENVGRDESADVYSLAVLLWDLLAAGRPQPTRVAMESTSENPVWIEPDVVRLVMRSLSADRAARPRDPGAFAAELHRVAALLTSKRDRRGALPPAVSSDEDVKTVPGVDQRLVDVDDGDEDATIELEAPPAASSGRGPFAVAVPNVREVAQPALPVGPRPPVPRPRSTVVRRSVSPTLRVVEPAEQACPPELCLTNEPRRWVVGRAPSAHLMVADPDMSREHFAIFWEGEGRYRVHDLGSKNGLFVNGKSATDLRLAPGDEVRAGATRLRFEA